MHYRYNLLPRRRVVGAYANKFCSCAGRIWILFKFCQRQNLVVPVQNAGVRAIQIQDDALNSSNSANGRIWANEKDQTIAQLRRDLVNANNKIAKLEQMIDPMTFLSSR
jgi:hypothetical protein